MTPIGLRDQLTESFVDCRQMAEDFGDTHHREIFRVYHVVAASSAHAVPTHTKEFQRRITTAQRLDELRAVHFTRSFTGGDENSHGSIVKGYTENERRCVW